MIACPEALIWLENDEAWDIDSKGNFVLTDKATKEDVKSFNLYKRTFFRKHRSAY